MHGTFFLFYLVEARSGQEYLNTRTDSPPFDEILRHVDSWRLPAHYCFSRQVSGAQRGTECSCFQTLSRRPSPLATQKSFFKFSTFPRFFAVPEEGGEGGFWCSVHIGVSVILLLARWPRPFAGFAPFLYCPLHAPIPHKPVG